MFLLWRLLSERRSKEKTRVFARPALLQLSSIHTTAAGRMPSTGVKQYETIETCNQLAENGKVTSATVCIFPADCSFFRHVNAVFLHIARIFPAFEICNFLAKVQTHIFCTNFGEQK